MKNSEQKNMNDTNEEEYQKSVKPVKSGVKFKEEGYTDGQGNFISMQNGVLTNAQKEQIKNGEWLKYTKGMDGAYTIEKSKKIIEKDAN